MATGTVETKDKVPVLMAGYDTAGISSILKMMSHKQKVNELVTTSEVKDDDYNITFVVCNMGGRYDTIDNWVSYLNKSEAIIYVIDSCEERCHIINKCIFGLKVLLDFEKFDKRSRPLLIWLNNQNRDDAITVPEFTELISKGLKYQLKKRLYSIKPVTLLKPETLRRGFSWLAFEYQKAVEKKQEHRQTITETFLKLLGSKKDKEEIDKVRVFMAGLENSGKSTILAKMMGEETKFWKDFSFLPWKVENTIYGVWKVPGQELERRVRNYDLKGTQILIFVVDSSDIKDTRFEETFDELRHLLNIEELRHVPLLIFLNKTDLWSLLEHFQNLLAEKLESELQNRAYYVQQCIATESEGLLPGFKMLDELKKQQEGRHK